MSAELTIKEVMTYIVSCLLTKYTYSINILIKFGNIPVAWENPKKNFVLEGLNFCIISDIIWDFEDARPLSC